MGHTLEGSGSTVEIAVNIDDEAIHPHSLFSLSSNIPDGVPDPLKLCPNHQSIPVFSYVSSRSGGCGGDPEKQV